MDQTLVQMGQFYARLNAGTEAERCSEHGYMHLAMGVLDRLLAPMS
jgi:hypothetical protein